MALLSKRAGFASEAARRESLASEAGHGTPYGLLRWQEAHAHIKSIQNQNIARY